MTIGNTADINCITAEVQSLVYRKDMIAEAGVTIPDTFMSFSYHEKDCGAKARWSEL